MSNARPQGSDFNFTSMDWDAYIAFRPVYPPALYSKIFSYHDSHSGQYSCALDVGAGIGIVSKELLQKFDRLIVSDASETYVEQAQVLFASVPKDRISFMQSRAEDLTKASQHESVDLVTAAECLHWSDLDTAIPQIASILKPGGTFAAWLYGVRPIFPESDEFAHARKIFYEIYDKMKHQYDVQIEKQDTSGGAAQMNSRLDRMAFDPATWTDVQRLHTRRDVSMAHTDWPNAPSKVREGEKVDGFGDQDLLRQEAGYEYLEGYLTNWIPPLNVPVLCQEELERLKEAMRGRKVWLTWPVVLVLATRR